MLSSPMGEVHRRDLPLFSQRKKTKRESVVRKKGSQFYGREREWVCVCKCKIERVRESSQNKGVGVKNFRRNQNRPTKFH